MKTCSKCGQPLSTSVDEFGSREAPICISCYLNPVNEKDVVTRESKLEEEIKDIEHEIAFLQDQIDDLECELKSLKRQLAEITVNKRQQWINGNPLPFENPCPNIVQ